MIVRRHVLLGHMERRVNGQAHQLFRHMIFDHPLLPHFVTHARALSNIGQLLAVHVSGPFGNDLTGLLGGHSGPPPLGFLKEQLTANHLAQDLLGEAIPILAGGVDGEALVQAPYLPVQLLLGNFLAIDKGCHRGLRRRRFLLETAEKEGRRRQGSDPGQGLPVQGGPG